MVTASAEGDRRRAGPARLRPRALWPPRCGGKVCRRSSSTTIESGWWTTCLEVLPRKGAGGLAILTTHFLEERRMADPLPTSPSSAPAPSASRPPSPRPTPGSPFTLYEAAAVPAGAASPTGGTCGCSRRGTSTCRRGPAAARRGRPGGARRRRLPHRPGAGRAGAGAARRPARDRAPPAARRRGCVEVSRDGLVKQRRDRHRGACRAPLPPARRGRRAEAASGSSAPTSCSTAPAAGTTPTASATAASRPPASGR